MLFYINNQFICDTMKPLEKWLEVNDYVKELVKIDPHVNLIHMQTVNEVICEMTVEQKQGVVRDVVEILMGKQKKLTLELNHTIAVMVIVDFLLPVEEWVSFCVTRVICALRMNMEEMVYIVENDNRWVQLLIKYSYIKPFVDRIIESHVNGGFQIMSEQDYVLIEKKIPGVMARIAYRMQEKVINNIKKDEERIQLYRELRDIINEKEKRKGLFDSFCYVHEMKDIKSKMFSIAFM